MLLIGPTGSGKTPLGDALERRGLWRRRCRHFDFGAQLRSLAASRQPPDGLTKDDTAFVSGVLQSGALLEDEHFYIAAALLRSFIGAGAIEELIVLNGLPRHAGQARDVGGIVDVCAVAVLECTPEGLLERIRTNSGGDRAGRIDDDAHAVRRRLDIFHRRTRPIIDYYRDSGTPILTADVGVGTSPEDVIAQLAEEEGVRGQG